MEQIYDKCCGVDVHKKLIVACIKHGRKQEVREFGATTRELLDLVGWLTEGSAEVIISVIGTDMSRSPTDAHLSSWVAFAPATTRALKSENQGKPGRATHSYAQR